MPKKSFIKLPELDTRSVLNVVEENFQKLGLVSVYIFNAYIFLL